MPLFMDLHKADDYERKPTIEEIKRNHIADLKTQARYGVRFIQYWINEEAGLVFCLMEAPNKESCSATHREAHGDMPCNIIELTGGDYISFMGPGNVSEFDITENADGTLDTGQRTVLALEVTSFGYDALINTTIDTFVRNSRGRMMSQNDNCIQVVFNNPLPAVHCALALQREFLSFKDQRIEIRLAVSSGNPVTEHDQMFAGVAQFARWVCTLTPNGQVAMSSQVAQSCNVELKASNDIRIVNPRDEKLIKSFMTAVENSFTDNVISVGNLTKELGVSEAQLYRRITALSGLSANNLIKEIRLRKALWLLNQKASNVAQIALSSGFNSPSYFAKSFQKRFGTLPAKLLKK